MIYLLRLIGFLIIGLLVLMLIIAFDTRKMTLLEFRDHYRKKLCLYGMIILGWPIALTFILILIPVTLFNSIKWIEILYHMTHIKKDKQEKKDNI